MTAAARTQYSEGVATLFLAFELSSSEWKLAFTVGIGQKPRLRSIPAGALDRVMEEIARAKKRFGLPAATRTVSCYEAGRDGFWLHRFLVAQGVDNRVVDSSSIEVKRRHRRAKTDRLDATKLVSMLVRSELGDSRVWSVVRVPSVEEEDQRQLHRELMTLRRERTRQINRIKGLLIAAGVRLRIGRDFFEQLDQVRLWDGTPLPSGLRFRLEGEFERLEFIRGQVADLEAERRRLLRESNSTTIEKVRRLQRLRAIGLDSAWVFTMELFGWRQFANRKQLGSLVGLTPTPHQSGGPAREQGIDKSGNRWVRAIVIQIAWGWLRHQPQSKLSLWYQERFGQGSKRLRRIGIVALARKLLIALWQFVEFGVIPEGAELKA
jgi:transposase